MVDHQKEYKRTGNGSRTMNPDYMKQQEDPDGEWGHNERQGLYTKNQKRKDSDTSERLLNKYLTATEQSLQELQIEIRMKQCAVKTDECYQLVPSALCLQCTKYKL